MIQPSKIYPLPAVPTSRQHLSCPSTLLQTGKWQLGQSATLFTQCYPGLCHTELVSISAQDAARSSCACCCSPECPRQVLLTVGTTTGVPFTCSSFVL